MNRKALGKGIEALIPDFEEGVPEGEHAGGSMDLLIDEIVPNRLQPRKHFDDEKFNELERSIQEHGVLQPVIVQKGKKGYELVVGERRWRASKKAGLKKIPAVIREVTDTESLEIALIENLNRQDLNPIEEADGYARLANDFGLTQEKIAKRMGKSREAVANTIRLLKLPRKVKEDIISGRLTMGHARALLGLNSEKEVEALRRQIVGQMLTVRQTEARVTRAKREAGKPTNKKTAKKDIFIRNLEMELERRLGTKVEIAPGKKGGKLIITYYSDDDLERIRGMVVQKIG
ncbi:MAG: ParB/RepB/Spo0J family partition protein [Nitrospinaceae bacterium]|jgi:ParB family chromosome partitioning protein|nr:ParB/RepB/Spo0J family partition protein [Nitrospinaceae bacterium]MDP6657332.1 ParB/RepB/Spo0J family partition protein [Nitrospinaceae bacterium]MDP6712771.1 ParB/RepB/Spo0J family partition protein [Nitrospinaceae bacterium]MDP7057238.1 ParB/RepB/Spo0J family partition protein [Nitrospinaceae bacterium]HAK38309.1 chromosome partitioning protein ParB [Nitrospina sp.]|tara:strand:+ start:712 stop:1581 length:870 start_codon:yes stop_codon:yes gene_type:complete